MMRGFVMLSILLAMSTCVENQSLICPEIKRYSGITQTTFANEFADVKKQYPTVTQFIADYKSLRDALRTCATGKVS